MAEPEDYAVGYRKPPVASRFRKGQSGNPRGRPKASKNTRTIWDEELRAPVIVTENGKRKKMPKNRAIARQTVNKAAAGDQKAISLVLAQTRLYEEAGESMVPALTLDGHDEIVLAELIRRIRESEPEEAPPAEDGPEPNPIDEPGDPT